MDILIEIIAEFFTMLFGMTRGDLTDLNGLNADRYGQFF